MTDRADWRHSFGLREAGVYYALILLVAALAVFTAATGRPGYLSAANLTNIAYQASLVGIMGVAMTVMLITGAFDLSVGSVAALSAATLIGLSGHLGFAGAAFAALAAAALVGLLNGVVVLFVGINAFIVTLGALTAVRGLVLIVTDGRSLMVEDPKILAAMAAFEGGRVAVYWPMAAAGVVLALVGLASLLRGRRTASAQGLGALGGGLAIYAAALAGGPGLTAPNPVVYAAAFTLAAWFVLGFTTLGRRIYAVGGNAEAARLAGVNVRAYKLSAFLLSSLAAGFAGVIFGSRLGSINPTALQGSELTVIAAAILGGTSLFGGAGSVIKTAVGALLLFTLTNGFNVLNLGANYQGLIEGVVLVAAAAIYTVGGDRVRARKAAPAAAAPAPQGGA
jgi:ribose/xylose/arabinose/galactoside ABC-type transport system permease subunit